MCLKKSPKPSELMMKIKLENLIKICKNPTTCKCNDKTRHHYFKK